MPAAVCACVASRTFWSSVQSASSFCTTVNCAVSDMNCVGSDGLDGSWYLSWATRSLRNVSWSSELERSVAGGVLAPVVVFVPVVALVPLTVVIALLREEVAWVGSDADVEAPRGRRRRAVGARGAPAAGGHGRFDRCLPLVVAARAP